MEGLEQRARQRIGGNEVGDLFGNVAQRNLWRGVAALQALVQQRDLLTDGLRQRFAARQDVLVIRRTLVRSAGNRAGRFLLDAADLQEGHPKIARHNIPERVRFVAVFQPFSRGFQKFAIEVVVQLLVRRQRIAQQSFQPGETFVKMLFALLDSLRRIVRPAPILRRIADGSGRLRVLRHPTLPVFFKVGAEFARGFRGSTACRSGRLRQNEYGIHQPNCDAGHRREKHDSHPHSFPAARANSFSLSCASITTRRAVSSTFIPVLSTSTASAARTSGDTFRSRSRLSRSCTSSSTSSTVIVSPFSRCSFQRRSARTSGVASKKIFSSAWGKTTVPISRPSITMPPPAPARCCSATRTARTAAIVASRDAACATSGVRIASVTSRPSRMTRFFTPVAACSEVGGRSSMCVSCASAARRASSSIGTCRLSAFSASARYIAPLSRYTYPRTSAIRRATLLFPEPAGPSMVMVSFRISWHNRSSLCGQISSINPTRHGQGYLCHSETHDVVAAVHVNGLASNAGTRFGEKKRGGCADFCSVHVAFHGRAFGVRLEHVTESGNASRGERLDRAGGNRIHANVLRPEIVRQIAYRCFERLLRYAHHVVPRHDLLGPIVRHRDDASACGHQRRRGPRHGHKRIHADIVRDPESFAGRAQKFAFQLFCRRKCDAVHQTVQRAVAILQFLEQPRDLLVVADIAHEACGARQFGDEVLRFLLQPLVLISDRQPPARLMQLLRDGPGDAALICEAEDHSRSLSVGHARSPSGAEVRPHTQDFKCDGTRARFLSANNAKRLAARAGSSSDNRSWPARRAATPFLFGRAAC